MSPDKLELKFVVQNNHQKSCAQTRRSPPLNFEKINAKQRLGIEHARTYHHLFSGRRKTPEQKAPDTMHSLLSSRQKEAFVSLAVCAHTTFFSSFRHDKVAAGLASKTGA
jgi:hypothetical protein